MATKLEKVIACHLLRLMWVPMFAPEVFLDRPRFEMEKEEEETREILLPDWQGSGSHGITIDQTEEGVFVKEVDHNSPAAKTGVVKEGDQIVSATIYFDNLQSGEVTELLKNVGHHTVGLRLQRKGDRSPLPGQTWSHDVFTSKSPEVVLSGDDEEYRRIYTTKIKPRLKSEDGVEVEHTGTQSRTITVTKRVTAYTVDVTGPEGVKDLDITSPEFKIKIPKHELTHISKAEIETEPGKTVIKIPQTDLSGRTTQVRDSHVGMRLPEVTSSGPTVESPSKKLEFGVPGIHMDAGIHVTRPEINGKTGEIDLKAGVPDILGSKIQGDMGGLQADLSLSPSKGPSVGISDPHIQGESKGNITFPSMKMPKFGISSPVCDVEVPQLDAAAPSVTSSKAQKALSKALQLLHQKSPLQLWKAPR
ncbi:hypothetical protein JRQ81_009124 [Phrynocephalus forsythii]|uniref:PDZ domain-containing protein n=1 Tax=Phrynocephalus forsythii TaxID=171643 RepID=A0A9Q0X9T8_9SAUR|nr:hypothetical protein JRQ81_009124 [Phrynocephalus forsythii]